MKLAENSQYFALITVLISSLCCIVPFLAIISGLTGGATLFSFIEPYRPFLFLFSATILGFGFYQEYKPKNFDSLRPCCKENALKKSKRNKKLLFLATTISVLIFAFPYYSNTFIKNKTGSILNTENQKILELEIDDMSCQGCANNIMLKLVEIQGIAESKVSFATKKATITYEGNTISDGEIIATIEQIGFTVK